MPDVEPSRENAQKLANYFHGTFGDRKILLCPLMKNGATEFNRYDGIMRSERYHFPPFVRHDIESETREQMAERKAEVRKILTPASDIRYAGWEDMVAYDDSIKTGRQMLGWVKWALQNKEILRFKNLYVVAGLDIVGISHYATAPKYKTWLGCEHILKNAVDEADSPRFHKTLSEISHLLDTIAGPSANGYPNGNETKALNNILGLYRRRRETGEI